MNRPTMNDVAKLAGVSQKSVSRVVNNEPNVTAKLRGNVEMAIAALGYLPDLAARSLAGARSRTVTVLLDSFPVDAPPPYIASVQAGAYEACRNHGYHLRLETIDLVKGRLTEQLAELQHAVRTDGFVLAGGVPDRADVMDWMEAQAIPYVRLSPFQDFKRAPYVSIDDHAAAGKLAHHLWGLGHRSFGLVAGAAFHGAMGARKSGFVETLDALGDNTVSTIDGQMGFEDGIAAGKQLISESSPPTAIFATTDMLAVGVMAGVTQLGMRIPDDISVVGFDDNLLAQTVWPYLTTIRQPVAAMAYTVAMLLLNQLARVDISELPLLETPLIIRDSTAPPRSG